jgi:hypothetical protein
MGMYTEIIFRAVINKNKLGPEVYNILDYLFNPSSKIANEELVLPNHKFFTCPRWQHIGNSSSFYHHPNTVNDWYQSPYDTSEDKDVYVFSRSDLKNYDGEIELFFDWVDTLDIFHPEEFMGYSLYEEDSLPEIYTSKNHVKE